MAPFDLCRHHVQDEWVRVSVQVGVEIVLQPGNITAKHVKPSEDLRNESAGGVILDVL